MNKMNTNNIGTMNTKHIRCYDEENETSYSEFIPTHILELVDDAEENGNFIRINLDGENWLNDHFWAQGVKVIRKLKNNVIIVVFRDVADDFERNVVGIYRGTIR
jgi:hypothetical protein